MTTRDEELKDAAGWENPLEGDPEQPRSFPVTDGDPRQRWSSQMEKLSSRDRKIFNNAAPMMGIGAAVWGLASNSMLRSLLSVREAAVISMFPSALIPFLTVTVIHEAAITESLLRGRLNCELCATTRGALVGALGSGLHPFAMAMLLNGALIARYRPWEGPTVAQMLRHMLEQGKPAVRRLGPFMLVQAAFGAYLGSKQFSIYVKMRSLPASEELLA